MWNMCLAPWTRVEYGRGSVMAQLWEQLCRPEPLPPDVRRAVGERNARCHAREKGQE